MASENDILQILTMLAAVYPRFTLSKETVAAYAILLEDLDADELRAAAKDAATKSQWFPSVHEIRARVVDLRRQANQVPTAYEAWAEVINTGPEKRSQVVERDGKFYIEESKYVFTHPLVEQVARLMGWPSKFPTNNESLMADRSHFLKAYDQALVEAMDQEITLPEIRDYIGARQQSRLGPGEED